MYRSREQFQAMDRFVIFTDFTASFAPSLLRAFLAQLRARTDATAVAVVTTDVRATDWATYPRRETPRIRLPPDDCGCRRRERLVDGLDSGGSRQALRACAHSKRWRNRPGDAAHVLAAGASSDGARPRTHRAAAVTGARPCIALTTGRCRFLVDLYLGCVIVPRISRRDRGGWQGEGLYHPHPFHAQARMGNVCSCDASRRDG